jgi:hypothetical protein
MQDMHAVLFSRECFRDELDMCVEHNFPNFPVCFLSLALAVTEHPRTMQKSLPACAVTSVVLVLWFGVFGATQILIPCPIFKYTSKMS